MTRIRKSLTILLSLAVMLCGVLGGAFSAEAAQYRTVEGTYNYTYASEVLTLLNEERARYNLKPLTMTEKLTDGAMLRAAETAVSFSHTRPNGEQCFTAFEWSRTAGENIAYGQRSPAQVMNGWMNSSGHRANILNADFTTVGICCFEYGGTLYWAQAFSGGSGSSYAVKGTRRVSVAVSLTAGVNSLVSDKETTAAETTKPRPAVPSTTKPRTTAPSTTKAPTTTKRETTTAATTQKATGAQRRTVRVIQWVRYRIQRWFR